MDDFGAEITDDLGYAPEIYASGPESGNLFSVIDKDNVHGLNLDVPEHARSVIKSWDEREDTTRWAESSVDDQLVIHVPFIQNVRLRSVLLKLGRGEVAPKRLRIYANHPNIVDFSEAELIPPQLHITLSEGATAVTEYPLRAAAFANINAVSLHFDEAVGEELSRVYFIGFKGDTRSVHREADTKLPVPAQNAADAPLVDRVTEKAKGRQDTAR